ncbi:uncharacterized protein LOC130049707 [Ostrea edulis]|uniref:uncharacterized protein LOC130049707 n=1 Tax=Ostrea edulis TaxID=37623 RepID=UPI0024AFCE26|nr:uncharacterized protein LOC130049707 [Ostrea edulis]
MITEDHEEYVRLEHLLRFCKNMGVLQKDAHESYRKKCVMAVPPPTPEQLNAVANAIGKYAKAKMRELTTKKIKINRDIVAVFNRYIAAEYDGEAFVRVAQGLADAQHRLQMTSTITISDARKSLETFAQGLPNHVQKDVADYLCHFTETRDKVYKYKDHFTVVQAVEGMRNMSNAYMENMNIANDVTSGVATAVVDAVETVVRDDAENDAANDDRNEATQLAPEETVSTPKKAGKYSTMPKTPKSPPSVGRTRVKDALVEKYGSFVDAKIPAAQQLLKFGIRKENRDKVARSLRYKQDDMIHRESAHYVLRKMHRKGKVPESVNDLSDKDIQVPSIVSRGKKLQIDILRRHLDVLIKEETVRKGGMKDEDLAALIESQEWPNVVITQDEVKGKCLTTGSRKIFKGQIVCDYHGEIISHKEGGKRLNSYNEGAPAGNYFYFYRHSNKRLCVDAAKLPCPCHPKKKTTSGRLINHSAKSPNLQTQIRVLNDKPHLFLVARTDIPPVTELFFDYGVCRSEDGEKLDWLQS